MKEIDLHLINVENKYKRAINHAFDLGWDASEERIIKLLEAADSACCDLAIALIKGEK